MVFQDGIPVSTAQLLAVKHHFRIDGVPELGGSHVVFSVRWLDPAQVAALRCELSIKFIEFNQVMILD